MDDEESNVPADEPGGVTDDERRREAERERLLEDVGASRLNTVQQRVAWLLNHRPETRNSDIALLIAHWEEFDENFSKADFTPTSLYTLTKPGTVARARALIQNRLRLFVADPEVRARRHTLSEEERLESRRPVQAQPPVSVFLDESGKTEANLIVGGLWTLNSQAEHALARTVRNWLRGREQVELHFANISNSNLGQHLDLLTRIYAEFTAFGFKYFCLPRKAAGAVASALVRMFYILLVEGIEHEHRSGRATLPRELSIWKDAEEASQDVLLIADLRDRLSNASSGRFGGQLSVGTIRAVSSTDNPLVQVCDLFTSCVNRMLNGTGATGNHAKDQVARQFVETFGVALDQTLTADDMINRVMF
jgi:hypothetical protein